MHIYSVSDPEFAPYGRVVEIDSAIVSAICEALAKKTPLPEATDYVASEPALEELPCANRLKLTLFGGVPAQLGWCNGHNTRLNCLEYHRSSEFNLGPEDFVLLLALESQIEDGTLDTSLVKAFRVPAGTMVEVYATTLHYAPCHVDPSRGFHVLVALPAGTNGPMPSPAPNAGADDALLWAANKWLLAHPESPEAAAGAHAGLTGEKLDVAEAI